MLLFRLALFALIPLSLLQSGCSAPSFETKPLIIVSLPPYQDLVQNLVGETARVISALPPGYDPHTAEMTPRQMQLFAKGVLWIGSGEPYEKKITRSLAEAAPDMARLTLKPTHALDSHASHGTCPHHKESGDLHFWLSLRELRPQIASIAEVLMRLLPQEKEKIHSRLTQLTRKIDDLDQILTAQLAFAQGQFILTSHAALGYFCRDYHLKDLAVECEGKSTSPQAALNILQLAEKQPPLCAFSFINHPQKALDLIADRLNLPVYSIDLLKPNVLKTIERLALDIATAPRFDKRIQPE